MGGAVIAASAVPWGKLLEGDPGRGALSPSLPPRGIGTVWRASAAALMVCPSSVLFPRLSQELVHGAIRALELLSYCPSTTGAGAQHVPGLSPPPDLPSLSGLIIG